MILYSMYAPRGGCIALAFLSSRWSPYNASVYNKSTYIYYMIWYVPLPLSSKLPLRARARPQTEPIATMEESSAFMYCSSARLNVLCGCVNSHRGKEIILIPRRKKRIIYVLRGDQNAYNNNVLLYDVLCNKSHYLYRGTYNIFMGTCEWRACACGCTHTHAIILMSCIPTMWWRSSRENTRHCVCVCGDGIRRHNRVAAVRFSVTTFLPENFSRNRSAITTIHTYVRRVCVGK